MKIMLAVILASQLSYAIVCPTGCEQHGDVCACDSPSIKGKSPDENFASDEKPRREQQPEWQTGEVIADMPQSLIAKDTALDNQIAEATRQGRLAAGISEEDNGKDPK